jgi:hypothetical protein
MFSKFTAHSIQYVDKNIYTIQVPIFEINTFKSTYLIVTWLFMILCSHFILYDFLLNWDRIFIFLCCLTTKQFTLKYTTLSSFTVVHI